MTHAAPPRAAAHSSYAATARVAAHPSYDASPSADRRDGESAARRPRGAGRAVGAAGRTRTTRGLRTASLDTTFREEAA
ncbi:hypothetical protein [Streptomyces sp. NPDC004788]